MRWQDRQDWQDRQRGWSRPGAALMLAVVIAVIGTPASTPAGAQGAAGDRGAPKPRKRAAPPARFEKATTTTFFDDAFTTLQGPRPSFAAGDRGPTAPGAVAQPTTGDPTVGGFIWSKIVSEETLTDEIKDRKADVAAAVANPSDFKGGGYDRAREAFSSIALAFGVIAAYDQDIRWKKDAATARDLFARVGVNCKVGTDQSHAESKARLEDLGAMLDGGRPESKADRDEDFRWSQVAARPALMNRLETAEHVIGSGMASRGDFDRAVDRIRHDAEIVAMIGEAIQQPDFEYHDDDSFRGYAAAMRDAAGKVREACGKKDYEAARAAASDLKKSCDACHGDYRS